MVVLNSTLLYLCGLLLLPQREIILKTVKVSLKIEAKVSCACTWKNKNKLCRYERGLWKIKF